MGWGRLPALTALLLPENYCQNHANAGDSIRCGMCGFLLVPWCAGRKGITNRQVGRWNCPAAPFLFRHRFQNSPRILSQYLIGLCYNLPSVRSVGNGYPYSHQSERFLCNTRGGVNSCAFTWLIPAMYRLESASSPPAGCTCWQPPPRLNTATRSLPTRPWNLLIPARFSRAMWSGLASIRPTFFAVFRSDGSAASAEPGWFTAASTPRFIRRRRTNWAPHMRWFRAMATLFGAQSWLIAPRETRSEFTTAVALKPTGSSRLAGTWLLPRGTCGPRCKRSVAVPSTVRFVRSGAPTAKNRASAPPTP